MKYIIFLLSVLQFVLVNAQVEVSGQLIEKKGGAPVIYANIGVLGESVGTVSDEDGKFKLVIPEKLKSSKIVVSSIGYQNLEFDNAKSFKKALGKKSQLKIVEDEGQMKEIVVKIPKKSDRKFKTREKYAIGFSSGLLGNEMGKLMISSDREVIDYVNVFLADNNEAIKLRVNFYSVTINGMPGNKLNRQNIIFEFEGTEKGSILLDVSEYNVEIAGQYIVTFELLEKGEFKFLAINNSNGFFRAVSMDEWKDSKFAPIVEVSYKP